MHVKLIKPYYAGENYMVIDKDIEVDCRWSRVHIGEEVFPSWRALHISPNRSLFVALTHGLDQNIEAGTEVIITDAKEKQ